MQAICDSDDAACVKRCIEGDEFAWRFLIARYEKFVAAVVRRILAHRGRRGDRQEIEEGAAEIFGDLCLRRREVLGSYRGDGPFRAWLAVFAANHARRKANELVRARERAAEYRDDAREGTAMERAADPDADAAAADVERALTRCLPQERLLFQLVYVDGASVERAAAVLGVSCEAVYLRKHRFHQRMKAILSETKDREVPRDLQRDPGSPPRRPTGRRESTA